MSLRHIIWRRTDGTIAITTPADQGDDLNVVAAKAITALPEGTQWVGTVDANDLAGLSRYFRNQWVYDGGVKVDMAKARVRKMEIIRAERDKRLAATDGAALKAMESGKIDKALSDKRQALRDIPANINMDAIATHQELESFSPAWLE